jgi:uncharacterized protein involved in type VI secretion and phage assembly
VSTFIQMMQTVAREEAGRVRGPALGVVTAVFPHSSDDGDTIYDVSLKLKEEGLEIRRVPMAVQFSGFAAPPRVGDPVIVEFLNGDLLQPVVIGFVYHSADRPPIHKEQEILIEHRVKDGTKNHLRFADDGTIFLQRDVKQLDDNKNAQTSLKIDGGSGDMEIKVGTDITITLSGSKVTIQADVEIQGDLTVKGSSGSTKISGNTVEGS